MKKVTLASLVLLVLAAPSYAQTAPLSFQDGLTIARENTSGTTFLFGRTEKGGAIFGFYFLRSDGRVIEKEVHRTSRDVVVEKEIEEIGGKIGKKGNIDPKVVAALRTRTLTKLPVKQYLQAALDKFKGEVTGYELILVDDVLQVKVSGTTPNSGDWQTTLDMATGQIIGGSNTKQKG